MILSLSLGSIDRAVRENYSSQWLYELDRRGGRANYSEKLSISASSCVRWTRAEANIVRYISEACAVVLM